MSFSPSRGQIVFGAALVLSLTPWASPALALAGGVALALLADKLDWENPLAGTGGRISGPLLRSGVVLLGFGMHLPFVLEVGQSGAWLAALTIAGTMAFGLGLGRTLGVEARTSILICAGTAVCGGSAIAAMAAVIGAARREIAVALATVFLLNASALYLFPWLGQALAMDPAQFGLWAGIAIHDLSSVVGAASTFGADALPMATAVKLSRTLWIVPMALIASFLLNRPEGGRIAVKPPYFILLFVMASVSRTVVAEIAAVAPSLTLIARSVLTAALFTIGAGISPSASAQVGWKPMAQGVILWIFISITALVGTMVD